MSSCAQVNQFLGTFQSFKAKDKSRMAYEIKPTDTIDLYEELNVLWTEKGKIEFARKKKAEVSAGDFIEIIQWPDIAVHWPRDQFIAQNVSESDRVINRGDATLETWGSGNLQTSGTVIQVGSRYFVEIYNGRVLTACYIGGATRYNRFIDQDKKRDKALAELEKRKKKPKVMEVGFWSRDVEEVQGGAA
ncbi:hypothetical protein ABC502_14390 [Alkalimonas sp. NCh-2]|uniref:hypothetical protein n=1 Tax=Alkalimonas sp. NCh-2 TaxID=3144846 RepID=UPI0031F60CCA